MMSHWGGRRRIAKKWTIMDIGCMTGKVTRGEGVQKGLTSFMDGPIGLRSKPLFSEIWYDRLMLTT